MRSKYFINLKTKKGAASFYVVIFVTLVLGVIVLGFTRIILQDATNTTDSDLSQSAYDAALAGIEDAKSALIKCKQEGSEKSSMCTELFESHKTDQCNVISNILYKGNPNQEVQLTEKAGQGQGNESLESQAYTCVKVNDVVEDYRVTLTSKLQIKVIPLSVQEGFGQADHIKISWYSNNNKTKEDEPSTQYLRPYEEGGEYYFTDSGVETTTNKSVKVPPVISAELVQADSSFYFEDFLANSGEHGHNGTNRSLSILYPTRGADGKNETDVRVDRVLQNGTDQKVHTPVPIACNDSDKNAEFACTANLELPDAIGGGHGRGKNAETAYLIVTIPYGRDDVDMKISVMRGKDALKFKNVQYAVDSTGRANDIYRRLSSRVELGNINFPFPEYAAQIGLPAGTGDNRLTKNFWITRKCRKTIGEKRNDDGTWPILGPGGYTFEECKNSDYL